MGLVTSALAKMASWVFSGMRKFFCWLLLWFLDRLNDVWAFFDPYIPAIDGNQLTPLFDAFVTVDAWVPASEILGSLSAYFGVYAAIVALKWFRRFLPF